MSTSILKSLMLEKYVTEDTIADISELRIKLQLTLDQMKKTIAKSKQRGCPLVCADGKIFRANNRTELEKKMRRVREMHNRRIIEHAEKNNKLHTL